MKKTILMIFYIMIFNIIFSASELDSLLQDDTEKFKDLLTEDTINEVPKKAFVSKLNGQAFLKLDNDDSWYQLVENAEIEEKMTILTTEKTTLSLKMEDGSFVNIGEKTKVYIESLKGRPQTEEITETGLNLLWGKIYSNVKKKVETGAKYEVKTGSVVAGVRGTKFTVSAAKNGRSDITVFSGIVSVKKIGSDLEILVNKNQKVKVDRKGSIGEIEQHQETPPEEEINPEETIAIVAEKIEEVKETKEESEEIKTLKEKAIEKKETIKEKSKEVVSEVKDGVKEETVNTNPEVISLKNNLTMIDNFVNQTVDQANAVEIIKKIQEIEEDKTNKLIIQIK
ncbi:FecR family protein [Hypnocyclicus thermotrophus]|uniref:FecR family protein n=1 Tax=Hypnocyclicus thermotrophus TaxID=1627895 RepID=A0AA46DWX4_9FUSO|nr:FecR family protein [Hypnocyclicus thermotrophus]TDT67354.1 FecR family protein [Hypnocyclicus thermotrophus]